MDLMDLGDVGSGCEEKNCGLTSGFPDDCSNQECYWEEPTFEMIELVCVTVIYIPLMLFGLLGNILTILVVCLRPYMRSSTYLYLSSMAVSDLLILLLLPLDLYKLWRPRPWPLGDLVCKLTMFLSECCTFCTILHITFLSLERYLAVCWPITAKTVVTRRRTKAVIGCLWLGAAVSAAPVLIMVGVEDVGGEELGLGQWREDGGWTGLDGEGGRSEHMAMMDGGLEGVKWGEEEPRRWSERELELFGDKAGDGRGRKQGDEGEMKDEREEGGEVKTGFKGELQSKKKDEGGWTDGEGRRSEHMALMDGGLEGVKWGEEEPRRWSERVGELELFGDKAGDGREKKEGEMKDEEEEGGEGKTGFEGELQSKKKEDEGGGRAGRVEVDRRECRCTHHAVTSGLLSAMMILSNLYFLVPLCILGLVYSLIGRTLWLRPKSSRRDQSHRSTVKMLGVIVLAFVVCWLPFHVGRTIYSFSLGSGSDISNAAEFLVSPNTLETATYDAQNSTPASINSQHSPIDRYDASLYHDDAHNSTFPHHDAHLDFLYYLSQYFNLVSSVLFYLSAAVNPLLYNLMSARYRHAVHSLVHARPRTQAPHLRSTLTARHSTTTL